MSGHRFEVKVWPRRSMCWVVVGKYATREEAEQRAAKLRRSERFHRLHADHVAVSEVLA